MKCHCGKHLELEDSKLLGVCYACRKEAWEHPEPSKSTSSGPELLAAFRETLKAAAQLTPEIDAHLLSILEIMNKQDRSR